MKRLAMYFLGISMLLISCSGMNEILNSPIKNVQVSTLPNGSYVGEYEEGRWNYKVQIDVKNNRIDTVIVLDCAYKEAKSMVEVNEVLVNRVIQDQSLMIDAASGASITSKAFQKAVEDALLKAQK